MTYRSGSHPDELISASLTGDLTTEERRELERHLATCESCRATLGAFSDERRLLSGLSQVPPPHDLAARVQSGIEGERFAAIPWWRRTGGMVALGASLATVAAAVLAVVVFSNLRPNPVGNATPSQSASAAPSGSLAASPKPSVEATPEPAFALGPGELGYLSLNGASLEPGRLTFNNDVTGASLGLGNASGPPLAAALSPDGRWLAYITRKGESGANEVWAAHLTDGSVVALGCSTEAPFTDRLAWSPDSSYLAFTLVSVDLGPTSGCPTNVSTTGRTDAWFFDVGSGERTKITGDGNSYAASFLPADQPTLLISVAAEAPWSAAVPLNADANPEHINGVFMPLVSPDGNRALFWNGTMKQQNESWQFSSGGMPQVSGDFRSAGPASPWTGTPLFADLTPVGGEAFAYGNFAWGPDNDLVAFWNGAWTGAPQGADGTYPSQPDAYVGRIRNGRLTSASRLPLTLGDNWVADLVFVPDGSGIAVTIGIPSAGIGDPPSARLLLMNADGTGTREVNPGADPPPWNGPAVFGP